MSESGEMAEVKELEEMATNGFQFVAESIVKSK